jgi:Holliday junction resolvase
LRYASRTDSTHAEIRRVLRELGYCVLDTSRYPGFVDMLAKRGPRVYLIEAKTPQSKSGRIDKTAAQTKLEQAGFEVVYLRSAEEAIAWGTTKTR